MLRSVGIPLRKVNNYYNIIQYLVSGSDNVNNLFVFMPMSGEQIKNGFLFSKKPFFIKHISLLH